MNPSGQHSVPTSTCRVALGKSSQPWVSFSWSVAGACYFSIGDCVIGRKEKNIDREKGNTSEREEKKEIKRREALNPRLPHGILTQLTTVQLPTPATAGTPGKVPNIHPPPPVRGATHRRPHPPTLAPSLAHRPPTCPTRPTPHSATAPVLAEAPAVPSFLTFFFLLASLASHPQEQPFLSL